MAMSLFLQDQPLDTSAHAGATASAALFAPHGVCVCVSLCVCERAYASMCVCASLYVCVSVRML